MESSLTYAARICQVIGCCIAAIAVTLTVTASADAGAGKTGKPKMRIETIKQSQLTKSGQVDVSIKSKQKLKKPKLSVALKQDGDTTKVDKTAKPKLKKGKAKTTSFQLGKSEPLVRSCLSTKIVATLQYKASRAARSARRRASS